MTVGELAGYVAAILVFATFYMKTMVPLRIAGIVSNVAFIIYSALENLPPVLILHVALLPLNVIRLRQIQRLIAQTREAASGDLSLEALLPFMTQQRFKAGDILFRKGDASLGMFYVVEGVVRLEEIDRKFGAGDMLGEISIFSPNKQRTATAVCETDVELLQMTEDTVLQLYHQNPKFGLHLVQVITRRLIERIAELDTSIRTRLPGQSSADGPRIVQDPPAALRDQRSPSDTSTEIAKHLRARKTALHLALSSAALAVVIYFGWHAAPYMRSVFFRDAALTTWINVATSPIKGTLEGKLPKPGQRVGASGQVVMVRNHQADNSAMKTLAAEAVRAEERVVDLDSHLARLRRLDAGWRKRTRDYAAAFKRNLDIEIDGAKRELAFVIEQLALVSAVAKRKEVLTGKGFTSQSDADEALAEVMALQSVQANLQKTIADAKQRRQAAEAGVFLRRDQGNPDWAFDSNDQLQLEIARITSALADAKAVLAKARVAAVAARDVYQRGSASAVVAPPGSVIWSVVAGEGATMEIGTPVIEWIDCDVILVDVPVNDVEIGLLHAGMPADIVIEGESETRKATILQSRGAAAALGGDDLAALAKGRKAGIGQVILRFESRPGDRQRCPVGQAAWVDFPEIDVIDLMRARLRL